MLFSHFFIYSVARAVLISISEIRYCTFRFHGTFKNNCSGNINIYSEICNLVGHDGHVPPPRGLQIIAVCLENDSAALLFEVILIY